MHCGLLVVLQAPLAPAYNRANDTIKIGLKQKNQRERNGEECRILEVGDIKGQAEINWKNL